MRTISRFPHLPPDERDDLISRLEQDNAEKDKKIGEYESRISELEAQLAAKKNGIKNGNDTKTCYLTFDDGPSNNTERILDILKENGVKATFFVIGRSSRLELVKREKEEGHTVALHTYSHEYDDVYRSTDAFFCRPSENKRRGGKYNRRKMQHHSFSRRLLQYRKQKLLQRNYDRAYEAGGGKGIFLF